MRCSHHAQHPAAHGRERSPPGTVVGKHRVGKRHLPRNPSHVHHATRERRHVVGSSHTRKPDRPVVHVDHPAQTGQRLELGCTHVGTRGNRQRLELQRARRPHKQRRRKPSSGPRVGRPHNVHPLKNQVPPVDHGKQPSSSSRPAVKHRARDRRPHPHRHAVHSHGVTASVGERTPRDPSTCQVDRERRTRARRRPRNNRSNIRQSGNPMPDERVVAPRQRRSVQHPCPKPNIHWPCHEGRTLSCVALIQNTIRVPIAGKKVKRKVRRVGR